MSEQQAPGTQGNGQPAGAGQCFMEDQGADDGRQQGFGPGIGGSDGEITQGEQEDQKNGGGDLRQAGKSGEDEEPPTRVWQIMAAVPHEKIEVEQRERQTPQKAHIGGADGGEILGQMFLSRRPRRLHEGGQKGDGYPDPGFHLALIERPEPGIGQGITLGEGVIGVQGVLMAAGDPGPALETGDDGRLAGDLAVFFHPAMKFRA